MLLVVKAWRYYVIFTFLLFACFGAFNRNLRPLVSDLYSFPCRFITFVVKCWIKTSSETIWPEEKYSRTALLSGQNNVVFNDFLWFFTKSIIFVQRFRDFNSLINRLHPAAFAMGRIASNELTSKKITRKNVKKWF